MFRVGVATLMRVVASHFTSSALLRMSEDYWLSLSCVAALIIAGSRQGIDAVHVRSFFRVAIDVAPASA